MLTRSLVAIFHASFHPTKGNVIDWALKSDESINLDGVEFSVLPSGLHLVERDTVYFSQGAHSGLAVFRRRPTRAQAHRGFRLSSLGILLQTAPRPRPWLHVPALRSLADSIYADADAREQDGDEDLLGLGASGDLTEADFAPAGKWFEERKAYGQVSTDSWSGWSDELDGVRPISSYALSTRSLTCSVEVCFPQYANASFATSLENIGPVVPHSVQICALTPARYDLHAPTS